MTGDQRKVMFGEIEIRMYPMILGDNPATKKGLPLSLGWKPFSTEILDVDAYEFQKLMQEKSRRRKPARLSWEYRHEYIGCLGYPPSDLIAVLHENAMIQKSRMENAGAENQNLFNDFFNTSAKAMLGASTFAVGTVATAGAVSWKALGDSSRLATNTALVTSKFTAKSVVTAGTFVFDAGKVTTKGVLDVSKATTNTMVKAGKVTTNAVVDVSKATTNTVVKAGQVTTNTVVNAGKLGLKAGQASARIVTAPVDYMFGGASRRASRRISMPSLPIQGDVVVSLPDLQDASA